MMARHGKREARRAMGLGKRMMSAFLATVMCVSMVQVSVLADEPTNAQIAEQDAAQILQDNGGDHLYYVWDDTADDFAVEDGELVTTDEALVKNFVPTDDNKTPTKVTLSKTITATGTENEFDVALQVTANEAIELSSKEPSSAVVLVIDTSYSMDACATCGDDSYSQSNRGFTWYHQKDCPHNPRGQDKLEVTYDLSRMKAAKDEAIAFLKTYAGFKTAADGTVTYEDPGADRYVAVVEFNGSASRVNFGTGMRESYWLQLHGANQTATQANLTTVSGKINDLETGSATNPDSALKLAEGLLASGTISGADNKFLVLLTDGEPNDNAGDNLTSDYAEGLGYDEPEGYRLRNDDDYDDPARRAYRIRNTLDTEFYSICFDAGNTVSGWMSSFSDKAVAADDAEDLHLAFKELIIRLMLAVDAWKVEDPMGAHISWIRTNALASHGENAVTADADGINWNLRADLASPATKIYDADGEEISADEYEPGMECEIEYNLSYRIKLDVAGIIDDAVTDAGPEATQAEIDAAVEAALAEYYAANGETRLDYYLTSTDDSTNETVYLNDAGQKIADGQEKLLSKWFNVPAVKGYAAPLSFTKVDPSGAPLPGAKFTLTNGDGTWSEMDISDADGSVVFDKWVPSGDTYTLTETEAPEGYDAVDPMNFTLAYGEGLEDINGEKVEDPIHVDYTDLTITKVWQKPAGETTPDSIAITLYQDGEVYTEDSGRNFEGLVIRKDACTVSPDGNTWTYVIENVPESALGHTYAYTVGEDPMAGWNTAYGTEDPLTITNTANGQVVFSVTKKWILPKGMTAGPNVTVYLNKEGETDAVQTKTVRDGETVYFSPVAKYDGQGQLITYTVSEASGAYQLAKPAEQGKAEGMVIPYTLTNTVEDEKTSVSGAKTWLDDGADHADDTITVELYKNGAATGTFADVSAATGWAYSFTDLPRYTFTYEGTNITAVAENVYTVQEVEVPEGYAAAYAGNDITNTRTGTTSFTVNKVWAADVEDAQHGMVTAIIYANGAEVASKTFEDTWTFTGLPMYDAQGKVIAYSVVEAEVPAGYTASYTKNGDYETTITNRPNRTDDVVTVTVNKVWQQPSDITAKTAEFVLLADGEPTGKTLTISGNGSASFTNLPKYEAVEDTLVEIEYTVEETALKGYKTERPTVEGNTWTFTNTIQDEITLSFNKTWIDPDDTERPSEITVSVQAYSFEKNEWEELETITIGKNDASGTSGKLPEFDDEGRRIDYRIQEKTVLGYTPAVTGGRESNGNYLYSIVNSIQQTTTSVPVTKIWKDDLADADRPEVTISLLQNGMEGGLYPNAEGVWAAGTAAVRFYYDADQAKVMADITVGEAVTTVEAPNWSAMVSVPKYSEDLSLRYAYSVDEYAVPAGYVKSIVDSSTVSNKRVGDLDLTLTKYWVDPTGTDRPEITLVLTGTAGDAVVETYRITADDNDGGTVSMGEISINGKTWTIKLSDLPKYDDNGVTITYALTEEPVDGYTSAAVEGQPFAIRNTIKQGTVSASAEKVWENMDVTGVYEPEYPASITVALFRDGKLVADSQQIVERTEENTYPIQEYDGLSKYASDGHVFTYEIFELDESGNKVDNGKTISFGDHNDYTVTYDGDTITNTFKVPAEYGWQVKTNYVHKDHNGIVLSTNSELYGPYYQSEPGTVEADPDDYKVCEADGLTYDLDTAKTNILSKDLVKNQVVELVINYILIDEAPEEPPLPPEDDTITVTVKKVWKGDEEETRPESITVQLLRNDEVYDEVELSEDNEWKYRWVDLNDNKNWSVEEIDVPAGYTSEVKQRGNTWTITNTFDEEVIPEEPVPGGDLPEIIIPDPQVPAGEKVTDPAKTGDPMMLWAAAAAMSGFGLGWLGLTGKKKDDEE